MNTMQPRDKIIPWYFVMFFVFIALVNTVMVTLAVRTNTGIVTDHPYEKGLAYNQIVEAEKNQQKLGWNGDIKYENENLYFTLKDRENKLIIPEKIIATITRPTQGGMDFTVELKDVKSPISFPVKGLWEVRVDATYNNVHYQQSKRIVVQ